MTQSSQPSQALVKPITLQSLNKMKSAGEKFTTVALYDASIARAAEQAGVEVVLIGDSLGMVVQGHGSTLPVTVEQICYHVAAVARGNQQSLIMSDLPFMSYATPEQALKNCGLVMQAGAHIVKLEGGQWLCDTVTQLVRNGVPVCSHLGLTPQSVNVFGGYRVQGRDEAAAEKMLQDALALEAAGASIMLLECVPHDLAERITKALRIPVIGIGAGNKTDAQVLVITDMLGLTPQPPKFSKNFLAATNSITSALAQYVSDVKSHVFPGDEHTFY